MRPYSTSKYAVLSLPEALEHELEDTNVGVTALCPDPIATNIETRWTTSY
jgi:short-subunit dehydrogenase